jgi:hypothetical protein
MAPLPQSRKTFRNKKALFARQAQNHDYINSPVHGAKTLNQYKLC